MSPPNVARPRRPANQPRALKPVTCHLCGLPVLMARPGPGWPPGRRFVFLQPDPVPGRGGIAVTREGLAVPSRGFPGDYDGHRCPARVVACKYCREPVRVLSQPPGAAERLAVVEPEPDAAGVVVVGADGYARRDPGGALDGERYRWHSMHGRGPRREDIARLMAARPVA